MRSASSARRYGRIVACCAFATLLALLTVVPSASAHPAGFTSVSRPVDLVPRAPYVVDLDVGLETPSLLAVGIDAVGTTEEVLVRELSPLLRGLGPFAGAIVRGDGSLRLALDVHALAPRLRALGRVS